MNFLEAQEPELAFDLSKLTTEGDWNRAGEAVFSAPTGFDILTPDDIHDPAIWEQFQFKADAEGALPGWRYVIRKKGNVELASTLCGGCHERVIDGLTVEGAPGTALVGALKSFAEHRTLRAAKNSVPRPALGSTANSSSSPSPGSIPIRAPRLRSSP